MAKQRHQYVLEGSMLAVRHLPEVRNLSGNLANPPLLFVIVYDEIQDEFKFDRVSFGAAKVLDPEMMERLGKKLWLLREADRLAEDAARAAAKTVGSGQGEAA